MENAKEEFLEHTGGSNDILCAKITKGYSWRDDADDSPIILPVNYTDEQYNEFLNALNFNYDSGYGTQYLYGFIWYKNGNWSSRGEYDGSEWWEYNSCPDIPSECISKP
jgi:hypothetical protein